MKRIFTILLFSLLVFSTGCDPYDILMDSMFGWLPGYEASYDGPVESHYTKDGEKENTPSTTDDIDISVLLPPNVCSDKPHSSFSPLKNDCVCNSGYYESNGQCLSASNKECTFDTDCSPDKNTRMECSSSTTSKRYRCNLHTYKCSTEYVNCQTEFGPDYICSNGNCVQG